MQFCKEIKDEFKLVHCFEKSRVVCINDTYQNMFEAL